jgi:hypothetical protein
MGVGFAITLTSQNTWGISGVLVLSSPPSGLWPKLNVVTGGALSQPLLTKV